MNIYDLLYQAACMGWQCSANEPTYEMSGLQLAAKYVLACMDNYNSRITIWQKMGWKDFVARDQQNLLECRVWLEAAGML